MQHHTSSQYARGAFYGLAAVCIWASFIVVSRLGVQTSLTPWNVAAIRFSVAGLLLLPLLISKGLALDRLGWTGVAAIVLGCGAQWACWSMSANCSLLPPMAAHYFRVSCR